MCQRETVCLRSLRECINKEPLKLQTQIKKKPENNKSEQRTDALIEIVDSKMSNMREM